MKRWCCVTFKWALWLSLGASPVALRSQAQQLQAETPESRHEGAVDASDDVLTADTSSDGGGVVADEGDASPDALAVELPDAEAPALEVELGAGLGIGLLTMELPSAGGILDLRQTAFPAANGALTFHVAPGQRWVWDIGLEYQTSLGLHLRDELAFALPENVHLRYQRFAVAVGPVLRLGEPAVHPLTLAASFGFAVSLLTPVERQHALRPVFSGGPILRLELQAPVSDRVWLRLGPEVQALPLVSASLREEGVDGSGLGVGGKLLLGIDVSSRMFLRLFLREMHQLSPVASPRLRSQVRSVTVGLGGLL